MSLGLPEILLIALVVLLLFGAKRLPDVARSVGRSMRILKAETKAMHDDEPPAGSTPTAHQELPAVPNPQQAQQTPQAQQAQQAQPPQQGDPH